ncbi:hypothetical protein N7540_000499 [Penicillium herquei]|nr:hypothetical protein N7540_000499 [Penicillium herquei]
MSNITPLSIERKARRTALRAICDDIRQAPGYYLEAADLKAAHIHRESQALTLEDGRPNQPRFFHRYGHKLPDPEEGEGFFKNKVILDDSCNTYLWHARRLGSFLDHYYDQCAYFLEDNLAHDLPPCNFYQEIGDFKFFGRITNEIPHFNWQAWCANEMRDGLHPHTKVSLITGVEGDDRLLRGEILLTIEAILARLRTASFREHIDAPVLLYSFMGLRHARVLEANFDGQSLSIRASKRYDFTRKDFDTVKLLTQYWFGGVSGQTKWNK